MLASGVVACGGGGGSDGAAGTDGADGGSIGTVSCTTQTGTGNPPTVRTTCVETSGVSAAAAESLGSSCTVPADAGAPADGGSPPDGGSILEADFAMSPCARDSIIGGCRTATGGELTTLWYYDDGTLSEDNVRAICEGLGATFVTP